MAELLDETKEARHRRKTIALVLAAIALVLLIVTIAWWRSLPNEDETAIVESETETGLPATLTAADLFAAYEADPTLAQFQAAQLVVAGNLATPPETGSAILLTTPDPLLDIAADVAPSDAVELADAEAGTEVTLICDGVTAGLRAPVLDSCVLAP